MKLIRQLGLGGMTIALALAAAPRAAQGQDAAGIARTAGGVQIDFQGADMRVVVAALAEAAGLNLVYADLPNRPVTLRTGAPVPVERLRIYLESLLRAHDLRLEEEEGGLLRVVGSGAAGGGAANVQQVAALGPVLPGGAVRVFVHPLRHAPADDLARSLGALYGIGDGGGGGGMERPTSLTEELRGQRYNDAPAAESPVADPRRTGLNASLQGPVQIVPDMRTNSLLIRATPGDYSTLRDAIMQLDTRPLQVLIEVLVAEVRRDRNLSTGVSLRVPNQVDNQSGAIIGGELGGPSTGDIVLRVLQLGAVRADVVLSALSSSGTVTVLSRPVVMAQNNEEARLLVGTERPFIQISRSLPTDGASRDQVVQYREVGTQLTIRPTINPDGYVTLAVLQEVSSATPETQFGAPIISTREAETRLLVKDGHTVVIGGLVDQQRSRGSSGIPYLREIPLIGRLFGTTTERTDVTELFLFLIPHVLRTDDEVDQATELVRERARRLDRVLPDSIPLFWRPAGDTIYLLPDTLSAPAASPAAPTSPRPSVQPAPSSLDPPPPPSPDVALRVEPRRLSRRGRDKRGRRRTGRRAGRGVEPDSPSATDRPSPPPGLSLVPRDGWRPLPQTAGEGWCEGLNARCSGRFGAGWWAAPHPGPPPQTARARVTRPTGCPERDRILPLSRAAGEGAGGRGRRRAQFGGSRSAPPPAPHQPPPAVSGEVGEWCSPGGGARRSRGPVGFTLIEMLVVLAMMGVGAMVVVPALRRPEDRGAAASADALAAAIGRARLAAVTRAVPVTVEVDVANARWTTVAHPADLQSDTVDAGVLPVLPDTRLAGGDGAFAAVMFDALGRARADRIAVSGRDGAQEIGVDAWTGAARVRSR
ncbi:MAG TPA: secretin N-terminal domain-containing protein [Longimicrobium sp.]|uniref:secretin N-terminal domain-containing protein n=1 Tax=Longimicrobium sp. TaxID=2029185 RepID=UPI002EDB3A66